MNRVLITGGGSGAGASMARAFADAGHQVVIAGRTPETLDRIAGGGIRAVTGDVGDLTASPGSSPMPVRSRS